MHVWFLQRLIGRMKASELIYTGEPVSAVDASSMGLITKLATASLKQNLRVATRIAAMSPLAIKRTRKLIFEMEDMTFLEVPDVSLKALSEAFSSEVAKKHGVRFGRSAPELAQQISRTVINNSLLQL